MSEYDQRQYHRIIERLGAYESRQIPVSRLISDLEGLLCALEDVNAEWRQAFRREWGVLEQEWAGALEHNSVELNISARRRVDAAVKRLKEITQSRIGNTGTVE